MKYGEHHFVYTVLSTHQHRRLSSSAEAELFHGWVPEEAPGLCLGAMLHENQSIPPKQVSLDLHKLNVSLGRHSTLR